MLGGKKHTEINRGTLPFEQTCAIQTEAGALLDGAEHEPDARHVLELVQISNCSAYGCEFVSTAQMLGTLLYTMDAKLLNAFPSVAKPLSQT